MLQKLAIAVVVLLAVLITALVLAPAQWLAGAMRDATKGRVELAEASGTIWKGQATLVLVAGSGSSAIRSSLPERLSWRLSPWALLTGTVDLTLAHPSALMQPLNVRRSLDGSVQASPATLRLPASLLIGLGAPWNTVRPGGQLAITWDRLQLEGGRVRSSSLNAEWQLASSALTPVSPFGHYRLQTNGAFPGTQLNLQTISGPLQLIGDGTIDEGGRLRFQGRAQAQPGIDPAIKGQLAGLIGLLGRRDGEAAILNFGS